VTDERLLAWIEEMDDLTDTTRHSRLVGLHRVVTAMAPETSQPFLRGLCRHADWKANRQIRRRKIGRVLPTMNLVAAGLTHLGDVEGESFNDAIRFRDGLMIAALALVPLRIGNFRDLEIGRSFRIRPAGFSIVLGQDETKAHRAFETELPELLQPHVARYLETYRPILLGKAELAHEFLWANDCGRRYSFANLGARISRLTKAMLGVAVSPHLFRDAAATTIARERPAQARAIAGILGHSSLRTAERHYIHAKCLDASRSYTALIEADLADSIRLAQTKHFKKENRR
jgi:site-specific recombinase XerD